MTAAPDVSALERLADYVRQCTMVTPLGRYPFTAMAHPDITRFPGRALWVIMPLPFPVSATGNDVLLKTHITKLVREAAIESGQNSPSLAQTVGEARVRLAGRAPIDESDDDIFDGEGLAKRFDILVEHTRLLALAA